jgi:hypothetical protein
LQGLTTVAHYDELRAMTFDDGISRLAVDYTDLRDYCAVDLGEPSRACIRGSRFRLWRRI